MKTGTMKANALRIAEIQVDYTTPGGTMKAKAAFVNTTSGFTHGWTTHHVWSQETLKRLADLREAMELDLAKAHFQTTNEASIQTDSDGQTVQSHQGLAEHLGSYPTDAEQVR
jgi:hypothetical protein